MFIQTEGSKACQLATTAEDDLRSRGRPEGRPLPYRLDRRAAPATKSRDADERREVAVLVGQLDEFDGLRRVAGRRAGGRIARPRRPDPRAVATPGTGRETVARRKCATRSAAADRQVRRASPGAVAARGTPDRGTRRSTGAAAWRASLGPPGRTAGSQARTATGRAPEPSNGTVREAPPRGEGERAGSPSGCRWSPGTRTRDFHRHH